MPKLLDLFCGGGGAAMGYHQAGFDDITGVDIAPQKHYPFRFIQADALEFLDAGGWRGFDAIHASPPCQKFTTLRTMWNAREHSDLIDPTRRQLKATGLPYVIENVPGAPLQFPIVLCGTTFGLGVGDAELRRHRLFEIRPWLPLPARCRHGIKPRVIGVYGGHGRDRRRQVNTQDYSTEERRLAMGIGWMTGEELSQAIPPAYTRFIGEQMLRHLELARQRLETKAPLRRN